MAYPLLVVCFFIFSLYSPSYSQDPSVSKPSPGHRHHDHLHEHRRHDHHKTAVETGMDTTKHQGSDKMTDKDYDRGQATEKAERDGDEGVIVRKDKAAKVGQSDGLSDGLADGRSVVTTFPPEAFVRTISPLVSIFPQIRKTDGNSSKTRQKKSRKFTRKPVHKKQVNRPRWYFLQNKGDGTEDIKDSKSRWSSGPHNRPLQNTASKKSGSNDLSDSMREYLSKHASSSELMSSYRHSNKTSHIELKDLVAEDKDADAETKDGNKRTNVSMKQEMRKGRWQNKEHRKRPVMKPCVGCSKVEARIAEARELHKQILKAQLLDKLRLVPTLTESPLPPKLPDQVFPDLPQQDHPGYEDQYYAKPTQLLVFGRDLGRHRLRKPRTGSFKFEVRGNVKSAVMKADLWVYKMHDAHDSHGQTLVVTQLDDSKGRRLRERSLVARLDTHVQEGWVRFDVTRLVHRWLERETPASLQMLAIRCKTCYRTSYRAIFGVKSNFRPVLVFKEHRQNVDSPRDRRSQCDPNSRCCKFDLTVRFHDLGIHEIFYPKSIRTGYCYGTCERPDLHYHNHTMIIQRLRYGSYRPVDGAMRERLTPCCVPVVLTEASLMHYINDGQDTQVSLIPNLLVDKCGCA